MEHVYKHHFGLSEAPFNITPDPSFLYLTASHREGLAQLIYGVNARRGFIVLTGEVGTGKTTLIHAFLGQLSNNTHTALIFSEITNPIDLLRHVCEEFRLIPPLSEIKSTHDYISALNEFLLKQYQDNQNAVLIIDEAQNLSAEVLESLRLLSNFETTKDKLLQIILVGQPELALKLNGSGLRQLKQRVTLRHQLRAFTATECREYIFSRLKHAGSNSEIFPSNTIDLIQRYSNGIPRLINVIADNAMLNAYALGITMIEPLLVHEVASDLCLTSSSHPSSVSTESLARTDAPSRKRMELVRAPIASPGAKRLNPNRLAGIDIGDVLPAEFLRYVLEALIDAIGPMASVVLTDHIKRLGASMERFPKVRIQSLIDALSVEVSSEVLLQNFRRSVTEELTKLNRHGSLDSTPRNNTFRGDS
jgi:type II secretory pathway predicted ATPase ExeA